MSGPLPDLRERLPRPSPRLVARAMLAFACAIALWYVVRVPWTDSVIGGARPVLAATIDHDANQRVLKVEDRVLIVNTGLPSPRGERRMVTVRNDGVDRVGWPVALLFALAALTPLARLRRIWPWAIAALAGAWGIQVVALVVEVLQQVGDVHAARGSAFLGGGARNALKLAGDYFELIAPIVPLALFLPVALMRPRDPLHGTGPDPEPGIARNAPCPCGSGEKFKRCCGTAGARATK